MQGQKAQQEGLFYYGSLDDLVPPDDPYRRLDQLLDLTWVRRETRALYSWTGRPSIDPVVIAKLLLIAYFEGITSERKLMRQVQVNLAFRRFLGYRLDQEVPDHSSLSRARYRLGRPFFQKLFEYVLRLCVDAGLVGGEHQSIDSTFVQANASLASLRPRLVALAAQQFTERVFRENPVEAVEHGAEEALPASCPGSGRRNDAFVSRTDPDCGLDRRGGGKGRLGYLVHYGVDRFKQVITGVHTVAAHVRDAGQLLPLVEQIRKRGIPVRSVAADKGYSAGAVYQALQERGMAAFIPLQQRGAERQGRFSQDHFTYDDRQDRYRCPNGAWLALRQVWNGARKYRPRAEDCRSCPLRPRCTTGRVRTLTISRYHGALEAARRRLRTPAARGAAIARRTGPERLFAEAKGQHGLRQARYRGLVQLEQQALLTATVQNLKRYLQAETRAFSGAAALRVAWPPFSSALMRSLRTLGGSFLGKQACLTAQQEAVPV